MMRINLLIAGEMPMDAVVITCLEINLARGSGAEAATWQSNHQANEGILEVIAVGALPPD